MKPTGAGQSFKPLEHNNLQVMGYSAESDQHNQRNLLSGNKSTTEQTLTNRNNTFDMLPENNTGKDAEAVARIYAIKMTKQCVTPSNEMRTPKVTLDNYPTNKLDPTTGPTREKNRDRNQVLKTELTLTTSSISKPNGSEHSKLTKEKEQYDTKQADKDKESQETSKHPSNNVPNIAVAYRHTAKQKAPIKPIDAPTTSTTTRINTSELSVMNNPTSNKAPLPETTQKLSATEITLGDTRQSQSDSPGSKVREITGRRL